MADLHDGSVAHQIEEEGDCAAVPLDIIDRHRKGLLTKTEAARLVAEVELLRSRWAVIDALTGDLQDIALGLVCTGVTAAWCPIHGDCTCPDRTLAMDDDRCPLHAHDSTHAEDDQEVHHA